MQVSQSSFDRISQCQILIINCEPNFLQIILTEMKHATWGWGHIFSYLHMEQPIGIWEGYHPRIIEPPVLCYKNLDDDKKYEVES